MPPYVKGGVWTNVEDEILRAAISKYGLNQWARVSSLLARKTAKQAKARWIEWLDPSIKKIEWSREEDEKLLHLAKIMPTQWRSIAPIIGRTATQCIERYQKLLDDAEKESDLNLIGVGESSSGVGEVKRFRPGDIDSTPESKPAKPDQVDMDEDEKEMLAEARARLANTQGKKAKRKDRERMLEESRRLAFLQKRRQLKQAGIVTKINTRPKNKSTAFSMDYNADIPFEHKPAIGFYDTSEEKLENLKQKVEYDKLIAGKGVPQGAKKNENEKDNDKNKNKKRIRDENSQLQSSQARAEQLRQLSQSDEISKRRKLQLPLPQVKEDELEQIIKHTKRGDQMKSYEGDDNDLGLTGDYSNTVGDSLRTPSIAPGQDNLRKATIDLINLTNQQSSLRGDENTPLYSNNEKSQNSINSLPTSNIQQTPNTVLTQKSQRDFFGINNLGLDSTPREIIRQKFQSLPKPKNDFEIILPEVEESHEIDTTTDNILEDASERDKRIELEKKIQQEKEFKRQSQVIQKNLPRPQHIPKSFPFPQLDNESNNSIYRDIIAQAQALLESDNIRFANKSSTSNGHSNINGKFNLILNDLDDDLKSKVEEMIHKELETSSLENENDEQNSIQLPQPNLSSIAQSLTEIAKNSNKQEEKLSKVLGGYIKRQSLLKNKFAEAQEALTNALIEKEAFTNLSNMESIACTNRISILQEEVNYVIDSERSAQETYRNLVDIRNSLLT